MSQTLLTGATGLLAHQRKLDVVANNIANLNTTGYKSQQVLFSDLIYTSLGKSLAPVGVQRGGVNPKQIGNGVQVSEINQNFSQGAVSSTGSEFDFALEGEGFFVLGSEEPKFTRDGSFSLDSNGYLVDPSTGNYVQRFGVIGEPLNGELGFQIPGDNRINVPIGADVPGRATEEATFFGNLPASSTPAIAEVLTTASPFEAGGLPATAATLVNDLDTNTTDYVAGDSIDIAGINVDGSNYSLSIAAGPALTLGDIVDAINAELVGATASIDADGNLSIVADEEGDAALAITLIDSDGNAGNTDFDNSVFVVTTEGKEADTLRSTIQVFDSRGEPHPLHVNFIKQDNNRWNAVFSSANNEVEVLDNQVNDIVFKEDGSFLQIGGSDIGDANIEFRVPSLNATQSVTLNLQRLSHLAADYSATFDQDGFAPGNIAAINVASDGTMTGVATNGSRVEVAQMAIASFANNQGLESVGENFFVQTSNSGIANIGGGLTEGRGAVRNGQLENSNVDVALEFTQLIVAQRGFSANARSITVATEVLQELNNIL